MPRSNKPICTINPRNKISKSENPSNKTPKKPNKFGSQKKKKKKKPKPKFCSQKHEKKKTQTTSAENDGCVHGGSVPDEVLDHLIVAGDRLRLAGGE